MKRLAKITCNKIPDIGQPNFIGPPQIDNDVKAAIESQINNDVRVIIEDLDDTLLQLREKYVQLYGLDCLDEIETNIWWSIQKYKYKSPDDNYRKEYNEKYFNGWR